jgi:hypothetical protein
MMSWIEVLIHSGGKGGVSMNTQMTKEPEEGLLSSEIPEAQEGGWISKEDNELLLPWIEWIEKVDFDSLWYKSTQ